LADLFSDMEKISGYDWIIGTESTYTTSGNLSHTFVTWHPFSAVVTEKYKIIEGTSRLLSADFSVSTEDMRNNYKVYGDTYQTTDTPPVDKQYYGSYSNSDSINQYGKRSEVETQTGLKSDSICNTIAGKVGPELVSPTIAGTVKILGTALARVGDLVFVKVPSLEINGSAINGNYSVFKVQHSLTENSFTTSLDLGKLQTNSDDYIYYTLQKINKNLKQAKKNFVKCPS
jgi:hypothetical protein